MGLTILYLMSFRKPISIIKDENGKLKERNILKDYMLKNYNEYLRNLVLALIDDNYPVTCRLDLGKDMG